MALEAEQSKVVEQTFNRLLKDLTTKRLAIQFQKCRRHQEQVIGNVDIHWDVMIARQRIVLIDQNFVFAVRKRRRIFERTMNVAFIGVHLWADIYVSEKPPRVFLEARAEWPGKSIGLKRCHEV